MYFCAMQFSWNMDGVSIMYNIYVNNSQFLTPNFISLGCPLSFLPILNKVVWLMLLYKIWVGLPQTWKVFHLTRIIIWISNKDSNLTYLKLSSFISAPSPPPHWFEILYFHSFSCLLLLAINVHLSFNLKPCSIF